MKCECGNDKFIAWAPVSGSVPVIVDEDGDYFEDCIADINDVICMEQPYGPFVCTECGKEYEELTKE